MYRLFRDCKNNESIRNKNLGKTLANWRYGEILLLKLILVKYESPILIK